MEYKIILGHTYINRHGHKVKPLAFCTSKPDLQERVVYRAVEGPDQSIYVVSTVRFGLSHRPIEIES